MSCVKMLVPQTDFTHTPQQVDLIPWVPELPYSTSVPGSLSFFPWLAYFLPSPRHSSYFCLSFRRCAVRPKPHHPQHSEHREVNTSVGSHGPVTLNQMQECFQEIFWPPYWRKIKLQSWWRSQVESGPKATTGKLSFQSHLNLKPIVCCSCFLPWVFSATP